MSAIEDVAAERIRQVEVEGFTTKHDDNYIDNELVNAAVCYALGKTNDNSFKWIWPWDTYWFKPTTKRRNLVKAAALLIAEIDRLDRITKNK